MKKRLLLIFLAVSLIFMNGCAQQEVEISPSVPKEAQEEVEQTDIQEPLPTTANKGLGNLCTGEEECISFCHNNRRQCEDYCAENGIEYCFPEGGTTANENKQIEDEERTYEEDSVIYEDLPSCGDKTDFFSALPISLSDLDFIRPLGFIGAAPEHIYPTDHVYFFLKNDGSPKRNPIEVPIYSSGDVWITRIKEVKMQKPTPDSTDYSIYFSPCKEFEAFYFHLSTISDKIKSEIKPPYKYCNSGQLGRFEVTSECEKEVRIKLSAGELMGTVGKLDWQYSFDLGAYDLRTQPLDYANPSRWQKWQQHIVCPFDYFSEEIKSKLKARLGEDVLRTIEPICGEIEQDEPGTTQGVWFIKGEKRMYARPELSLIHDFIDPSIGAFAFGFLPAESGLLPDVLHFNPKNSGLVNRDFKDVTDDGNIYCYDNLIKQWSYERKPEQLIILAQLTNPTSLRIEGKKANSCGSGPWSFDKPAEFER